MLLVASGNFFFNSSMSLTWPDSQAQRESERKSKPGKVPSLLSLFPVLTCRMVWPPLPGILLINIFIQLIIQFCPHGDKDLSLEFHIKYDINLSNRSVQLITNELALKDADTFNCHMV